MRRLIRVVEEDTWIVYKAGAQSADEQYHASETFLA